MIYRPTVIALAIFLSISLLVYGQDSDSSDSAERTLQPMSLERLSEVLQALDPNIEKNGGRFLLSIEDIKVMVVVDTANDRMRVMTPIRAQKDVSSAEMTRMMQANFDSALDARYAIARDVLWAAFVHPLTPLQKNQLISGIGQVINLALSYGTVYSSGGLNFSGGDSGGITRDLIDELLEKGQEV